MSANTCNPAGLPFHPDYLDDLELPPVKARIWHDAEGWHDGLVWHVDGCAVVGGHLALTAQVDDFETWPAAVAAVPDFLRSYR